MNYSEHFTYFNRCVKLLSTEKVGSMSYLKVLIVSLTVLIEMGASFAEVNSPDKARKHYQTALGRVRAMRLMSTHQQQYAKLENYLKKLLEQIDILEHIEAMDAAIADECGDGNATSETSISFVSIEGGPILHTTPVRRKVGESPNEQRYNLFGRGSEDVTTAEESVGVRVKQNIPFQAVSGLSLHQGYNAPEDKLE